LTTANVYDRVLQAASSYPGLRGTMALQETATDGTIQLSGSFATSLPDFGGAHTSDLKLQSAETPPQALAVRAIDNSIYCRLGAAPWQDVSLANLTNNHTTQAASLRNLAAQLLAGLDPREYTNLLSYAHGLKALPAEAGADRRAFAGTVELDRSDSTTFRYALGLFTSYQAAGINTETFTATFDRQARPTALHEHLASAKLTVDYQLTITGYSGAKVSAPI
jgi:hypothetical protein